MEIKFKILILLVILIVSILYLFIEMSNYNTQQKILDTNPNKSIYTHRVICLNGSPEWFNNQSWLVCGGENPLKVNRNLMFNIEI